VAASDQGAASCAFLQAGEGARPDVLCLPGVFGRSAPALALEARRRGDPDLLAAAALTGRAGDGRARAGALGAWLRPAASRGGLFWELGNPFEDAQVWPALGPGFPWHRVGPAGKAPARSTAVAALLADLTAFCQRPRHQTACRPGGPLGQFLGHGLGVLAARLARDEPALARSLTRAGLALAPRDPSLHHNAAVLALGNGEPALALTMAEQALALDPGYARAHRPAARAALLLGAEAALLAHAEVLAHSAAGRSLLGELAEEAGRRGRPALAGRLAALRHSRPAGGSTPGRGD
jgi:hypothetical protein